MALFDGEPRGRPASPARSVLLIILSVSRLCIVLLRGWGETAHAQQKIRATKGQTSTAPV